MSNADDARAVAQLRADAARAKLTQTLVHLQARVNPRALARDAIDELRETGMSIAQQAIDAAKRNPAPLIGIGATVIAILARDWITHAIIRHAPGATGDDRQRSELDGDDTTAKGS